jgi:hypothetical protein
MTALLTYNNMNRVLKYINWLQSAEWVYGKMRTAYTYVHETLIAPVLIVTGAIEAVESTIKGVFVVGVVTLFVGGIVGVCLCSHRAATR